MDPLDPRSRTISSFLNFLTRENNPPQEQQYATSEQRFQSDAAQLLYALNLISFCEARYTLALPKLKTTFALDEHGFLTALHYLLAAYERHFSCPLFTPGMLQSLFERSEFEIRLKTLSLPLHIPDLDYLCILFETLTAYSRSKKEGIFYTPPALAKKMVHHALTLRPAGSAQTLPHILDPSCGSGIFLLEAYRALRARSAENLPLPWRMNLVRQHLFGVDKDTRAVDAARLLLLFAVHEGDAPEPSDGAPFGASIRCGNSLIAPGDLQRIPDTTIHDCEALAPFDWVSEFPDTVTFDCIIGNPPYGLSRNEQLSATENQLLKEIYRDHRSGRVNKYLLFMNRMFELLATPGALSFVVPNAWLGIKEATAVRTRFLTGGQLCTIDTFDTSVFERASVEAVTFLVRKPHACTPVRVSHFTSIESAEAYQTCELPHDVLLQRPEHTIPLLWDPSIQAILSRVSAASIPLGASDSSFEALIALQAYATGKGTPAQSAADVRDHVFHHRTRNNENCYPYLEGSHVTSFSHLWQGTYLHYGEWLAEPQKLERYQGPRIIVREISAAVPYLLRASYIDTTTLYNRSVLHIRPREAHLEVELKALTVILNSRIASAVILSNGKKSQRRLFPKLLNADLKQFPVPHSLKATAHPLAELHDRLSALAAHIQSGNPDPEDPCRQEFIELRQLADSLVYDTYALSQSERSTIDDFLLSRGASESKSEHSMTL